MSHGFHFEVVPVDEAAVDGVMKPVEEHPAVLIVDDEPLIVECLAAILRGAGLTVATARDGSSALELAMSQPPQLLLTDVAMPGMNGIELAMTVTDTLPGCKVLLFSGHATHGDLTEARAGGYDFPLLEKPVHPRELMKRVFERLSEAGWMNEAVAVC